MKYPVHCPLLSEFEASLEGVARPVVLLENSWERPTPTDITSFNSYASAALNAVLAGDAVEVVKTTPYGCSMK